jgi:two-component system NtrC family response regulator
MTEKILIVDDEGTILDVLSLALEHKGFRVTKAKSGREGLDLIKSEHVDLIVTDIRLPDIDGLELLKQSKELDSQIEVIVLTGFVTIENIRMASLNGAFSFLGKPLEDLDQLYSVVNQALIKRKANLAKMHYN